MVVLERRGEIGCFDHFRFLNGGIKKKAIKKFSPRFGVSRPGDSCREAASHKPRAISEGGKWVILISLGS